jgi:ABC-2 type transport system ATP-binding protein
MIELEHTTLLYGTVIGVNDFHLSIPVGAFALVGPNGAGKSTLISLLTGVARPTLGRVRVFGQDPFSNPQVLKRVGLCPATDLLVQGVSARQWIELQLALSGWTLRGAKARAKEVLQAVGIDEAMERPIHGYSLGMRQRCKLAQAIAHDPELLILDEPFNGLDPVGRFHMTQFLRDWSASGRSLLLASHVLHEVERITNSFLLIYGGKLLASGTAEDLRRLLAGLPQQIRLVSHDVNRLATMVAGKTWLRAMERGDDDNTLLVSVENPLELYQALSEWVAEGKLDVQQIIGADGDVSALFHLLVSKHRGSVFSTGESQ